MIVILPRRAIFHQLGQWPYSPHPKLDALCHFSIFFGQSKHASASIISDLRGFPVYMNL